MTEQDQSNLPSALALRGFAIVADLLSSKEVDALSLAISSTGESGSVRKRRQVYAIRNLLNLVPAVAALATSEKLLSLARSALGANAFPVRATLFDKTADANWLVPWHQDLTICVKERVDSPGYGPWTVKAGVHNVQPPISILESMVAVRLNLDDTHERNGALRVLPSTHCLGRFTSAQIRLQQQIVSSVICEVGRGGVLIMKPLLLHASSAAEAPSHRRVIHIDYAGCDLADGLEWFTE